MDPVSLALCLAVSTADATTSLYKLCATWPDAPQGIHELTDDLERANVFFNLVKDGLQSPDKDAISLEKRQPPIQKIAHLLQKLERIIAKIKSFSSSLLLDEGSIGSNKTRRLTWLDNIPATNRLRRALKNNMADICALLILHHLIVSEEARAALEDVNEQFTSRRLATTARGSRRLVTETAHPPSKQLQDYRVHTEKLLHDIEQVRSGGHVKYLQTEFSQQKHQMQLTFQPFAELDEQFLDQNSPALGAGEKIPLAHVGSLAPYIHSIGPDECQECVCRGTLRHGSWSVPWLNRVWGSVVVSYYGIPFWKTACTQSKCLRCRAKGLLPWIRASYTLPPWLSQITLFAFVSLRPPAPELLLRVINRYPNMSSTDGFWNLIGLVERGDLEALKFSIANRLASVHDVHHATGQTALHFAIRLESFDMVKILLHAGADPFQGPVPSSAVTALLSRIHTGSPGIRRIASLFSVTEIMETYEYTDLHKIVLGIQPLDLSEAMARSQVLVSQVNTPTVAGLTPAHVAAIRGGVAHLAALKNAGADLSLQTLDKKTALHLACTYKKASVARFILDTERVADQATAIGMTPLHCIVTAPTIDADMWDVADRLLELGADINARATCDVPPLMYAANAGSPEAIEYLLSHGANINARDVDGDTALVEAIFSNSPDCVWVLLQRGADIKAVNKYGRGPLHYVAGAASEAIIDIFQRTGAFSRGDVDKYALDKDGLHATDIFNRRPRRSAELQEKFRRLLDSIPDYIIGSNLDKAVGEHPSSPSVSSSSGDEYFDAE